MTEASRYEVPAPGSDPGTDYRFAAAKGVEEEAEIYENVSCSLPAPNVIIPQVELNLPVQTQSTQPMKTEPIGINFKIKLILILIAISIIVNLILAACGLGLAIQTGVNIAQVQRQSNILTDIVGNLATNNSIRLVGGTSSSGRVEILHDGVWGTICDDNIDYDAGDLMCRMLGFDHASNMQCCAAYGEGKGPIWLDDLSCSGDEVFLEECSHGGWRVSNCHHSEDLSISCA